MKPQRTKQEDSPDTAPMGAPSVPWIVPSHSYKPATDPNPYAHTGSDHFQEHPKSYHNGFGFTRPSELDLSYIPDAFASTSSLDLLGTIAEMKLPSAKSLENIQKYGMDGIGPSTASLGDWYSMFPDTNHSSMSDFQSNLKNFDSPQNRLMPWDLNRSSNPPKNGSRSNNSNGNNNGNMKHSLSRELLQAVADAEAQEKTELEKLVKNQQLEKLKQEGQAIANNPTDVNPSQRSPPTSSPSHSGVDARRSSSIENFMSVLLLPCPYSFLI